MTQLSDKDRKAQMADMASFDEQMPSVGSFSFDPMQKALFNVRKVEITPKMIEDARVKGVQVIESPAQMDDHSVLGGSIRWNTDKFEIQAGHWAEPIKEEITTLIEKEFALPYFEFVYDEHWDQGHGWTGDMHGSR